jgi:hypothetical protein
MQIEDLIFEDDARGYFEDMSDLDALLVAGIDDGEIYYGCAVNPDIDPGREFGALGWCAQLVTRIQDLGFNEAMKADAWQHRSIAASQRRAMAAMGPISRPASSRLTPKTTPRSLWAKTEPSGAPPEPPSR